MDNIRTDIVKTALDNLQDEVKYSYQVNAEGLVRVKLNGEEKHLFLVRQIPLQSQVLFNYAGSVVGVEAGKQLITSSEKITRNSKLGQLILDLEDFKEEIFYKGNSGYEKTAQLIHRAVYSAETNGGSSDLINSTITMMVSNETISYFDRSLKFYLRLIEQSISLSDDEIKKLELAKIKAIDAEEKLKLERQIEFEKSKSSERKELLNEYRKQVKGLKSIFSPDKRQNLIKRGKLYDNPIIIDGGPGTGKTTLMIHRIQFLMSLKSEDIRKDYFEELGNRVDFSNIKANDYLIFTPTKLLKEYLKQALNREQLSTSNDNLVVWNEYRRKIFREFRYFSENGIFKDLTSKEYTHILNLSIHDVLEIEKLYMTFVLYQFKLKIKNLLSYEFGAFSWGNSGISIRRDIEGLVRITEFNGFINNLRRIEEEHSNKVSKNDNELLALLKGATLDIFIQLKKVPEDFEWAIEFFKQLPLNQQFLEDEDEIISNEEESSLEDNDDGFVEEENYEEKLRVFISNTLKIIALKKIDNSTKYSKRQKAFIDRLSDYFTTDSFDQIGEAALFSKLFKPFVKGPEIILLNSYSSSYKKFRKSILFATFRLNFNEAYFSKYVSDSSTGKVHADEQDLILFLLLRLIRTFFKSSQSFFNNSKNRFIISFKEISKTVIAVDEATDYSALQLLTITMLSKPEYNCVMLCGDLMQRMTNHGVTNWNDYLGAVPGSELFNLETSYRQTPVLLGLARKLYFNSVGLKAKYKASEKLNFPHKPNPVFIITSDESEKVSWLAKRIHYLVSKFEDNSVPNLTIFVENANKAREVAELINGNELLSGIGVFAVACDEGKIDSSESLRVFPIEYIKGLEFEGVFFWDVDKLTSSNDFDVEKLIYIGISRASIYLGLIFDTEIPTPLKPFKGTLRDNWVTEEFSDLLID